MASRFVIVDPSLRDGRGHHHALARRVAQSAIANGLEPVALCHRDAAFVEVGGAPALPRLTTSLYDAYGRDAAGGRLAHLARRLARHLKPGAGAPTPDVDFAALILDGCREIGVGAEDHLLFHTADGMTYAAVAAALAKMPPGARPQVHLCTPYDPEGVMPNRIAARPIAATVAAWAAEGAIGRTVHLYGENARLAGHLARLWGVPVGTLALPAPEVPPGIGDGVPWPAGTRLRIAHLGPARVEKGFHLLPDIVAETLAAIGPSGVEADAPPIAFAIQATPQIVGFAPEVVTAIDRLRRFPPALVRLIDETLSEDDYLALTASCDVVLMPYGRREYAYRSSGVVSEALGLDRIIVATTGTYPASAIAPGAGLAAETPSGFGAALATILGDIDAFRAGAARAGAAYRASAALPNYVARCLWAARGGLPDDAPRPAA